MSVRKSNFDVFGVLFASLRSFRMAILESGSTKQIESVGRGSVWEYPSQ